MADVGGNADTFLEKLVAIRRDLHMHPELAFQEHRTAAMIAERLDALKLTVQTGVAKTGVVAVLEGGSPGPTVALRADMDALPLPDLKDVPYRSKVDGVCHACGHDAHVTMLLGAAELLAAQRSELPGTVKFIFQPAEEGPGGALPMIEEGRAGRCRRHFRYPRVPGISVGHRPRRTRQHVGRCRYVYYHHQGSERPRGPSPSESGRDGGGGRGHPQPASDRQQGGRSPCLRCVGHRDDSGRVEGKRRLR